MEGWTHETAINNLEAEVKALKLQVSDLQNALRDVLDISEVEGAVNLTTMEFCKLMAARDLVPKADLKPKCEPDCRVHHYLEDSTEKRVDERQTCAECGHSKEMHPVLKCSVLLINNQMCDCKCWATSR